MVKLYIVRHGETEWNAAGRLQGHLDSNLTDKGIHDARLLARKLAQIPFEKVISSLSNRAVRTAKILLEERQELAVEKDSRLMEINLGTWQGKRISEIKRISQENYQSYLQEPELYQAVLNGPDAESFRDVRKRLAAFLREVEETIQSGNVLIITHGVVIQVLRMICKESSLADIWQPPVIDGTSLTLIKTTAGKRELLLEGDSSHKE